MKALVTDIGSQALDGKEPMIILFGEGATEHLKKYSVIQQFQEKTTLNLTKGDYLKIGDQRYTIQEVGAFANSNLNSISHVTLVFSEVPKEDPIMNGIYLSPSTMPKIAVGTTIDYLSNGE